MSKSAGGLIGGVVGPRGIGAVHLREIANAGADRLVIASRTASSEDAAVFSKRLGRSVTAAASIEALADMCDFVSICTPNELHLEHAAVCLDRGCHVLVEKPLYWPGEATLGELTAACDDIFRRAQGRLAVNYPTAMFAEPYFAICGRPETVCDFAFSYRTRGTYSGDSIAVDLLPHAFSLFLELCPSGPVAVREKRSGADFWSARIDIGGVRCRLDFRQDPEAKRSDLAFAIDGQNARRVQKPEGDGFGVFLDLPGVRERPVRIENPMASSIQSAVAACVGGETYDEEPARTREIMRLIASSLLE